MKPSQIKTIGIVHSSYKSREKSLKQDNTKLSEIEILNEFVEGLKDIETFSHLHIYYFLHKSSSYSLLTMTPWDNIKHGVFATRSPNRPSPIAHTIVKLIERENNVLKVEGLDAIEGTPVLDIKPYILSLDSRLFATDGWFGKRKLPFTPRVYEYRTETEWKEGKEGISKAQHKDDVRIGCPPEFGGEDFYWSPEHLFVSSVEVCIMTTFLDKLKKNNLSILSYRSNATGKAQLVNAIFKFKTILVKPFVTIEEKEDVDKIEKLLYKSANECMVSNTLNVKVDTKAVITTK